MKALAAAALFVILSAPPGTRAQPAPADPTIRTAVQEVVVDLIVRDRKGRFIGDLRPEEVEVLEDGRPQRIVSFRLIQGRAATERGESVRLDPLRQIRLVSLVFDRLGQDARRLARRAALDLLQNHSSPNTYYAVLRIDHSLGVLQPFTRDPGKLRAAVERATGGAPAQYDTSDLSLERLGGSSGANAPAAEDLSTIAGPVDAGAMGAAAAEAAVSRTVTAMLQLSQSFARQQQGNSSLTALLALVKGQQSLPGRKSVLYFSEGLELSHDVMHQFETLIGQANRANVAFYAVDARGLITSSLLSGNADALAEAAAAGRRARRRNTGILNRGDMVSADTVLDSVRSNTQGNLETLAVATGGFLMANSNDLRKPVRRFVEDVYSYYELTYRPSNPNFDGRFRRLEVKVRRPKVVVQSRSGYFAMPPELADALFPYEVPLLKALAADPPPSDLRLRTAWFRFGSDGASLRCVFEAEVPLADLTLVREESGTRYRGGMQLVTVFRDESGKPVRKFTREVPFDLPGDKLEAFRAGNFIYTGHALLPPGRYTMETAAGDAQSGRIAVASSPVVLSPASEGVGLSDVVLIRRVDPAPQAGSGHVDPLRFQNGKVVPSLDRRVPAARQGQLSFYFVIYPDPAAERAPELTIRLFRDGKLAGRARPQLPPPDEHGRIPYIASMPRASFSPGSYETVVSVRQGDSSVEKRFAFTVR